MSVNQIDVNAVNQRVKNEAAVALGRLGGLKGGKSTSEAKKRAARRNGLKNKKKTA